MKDKEKQIKEMAKIIETGCADVECTEKCKYRKEDPYLCYTKLCAEKIYNLFYPKDSVVLSMEEKQEYENLAKLLIYDKPIKSRVYEFIKETKEQARKETAEKCNSILEKNYKDWLKVLNDLKIDTSNKNILVSIVCGLFKNSQEDIVKQFGVEIKE